MSRTHKLKPNPQIPTTSTRLKKQAKELHKCKVPMHIKTLKRDQIASFKKI
jgi:hypothetical protein